MSVSSRVLLPRVSAPSRSGVAGRFFDQKTKNENTRLRRAIDLVEATIEAVRQ